MASERQRLSAQSPPPETRSRALPVNRQSGHPLLRALPALALLGLLALGLTMLVLINLYAIKSAWGIDLFPETHLRDLLHVEPP